MNDKDDNFIPLLMSDFLNKLISKNNFLNK